MPDPIIDAFVTGYTAQTTDQDRDEFARNAVEAIEASGSTVQSFGRVVNIGAAVNKDFTGFMQTFQPKPIQPVALEEVNRTLEDARDESPWYRRAIANTLGAIEDYQRNVVEPSAATVLDTALGLVPGSQPLEKQLDIAKASIALEKGIETRNLSINDKFKAAGNAWRSTDMQWGMKGAMELIFDPLNLVGLGLPGKVGHSVPFLKPLMLPLQAVDQLPNAVIERTFSGIGKVATSLPGVKSALQPAEATRLHNVGNQVRASVRSAMGHGVLQANNPASTRAALAEGLTKFPEDAGPYSLRNAMNHLEDIMDDGKLIKLGDGSSGTKYDKFLEEINRLTPEEAAEQISATVVQLERKATAKGGKLLDGTTIVGTKSERRIAAITTSISKRMANDDRWGKAIATAIDGTLNKFESIWLRKIEPNVVRPWVLSHLAFAGYMPMNLIEDIGFATVGMGVNPMNFTDDMYRMTTAGLIGDELPPAFLNTAEKQMQDTSRLALGLYEAGERTDNIATRIIQKMGIEQSGRMGFGIQRQAWGKEYWKEFNKVLRERGVSDESIDTIKDFIRTEMPESLKGLDDQIGMPAWMAASTGDPNAVRNLVELVTPEKLLQNAQFEIMKDFSQLPPDVRKFMFDKILDGSVNAGNVDEVTAHARNEIIKWHRLTEEGMAQQFGNAVESIGQREVSSGSEAASLMRWMQWAGDALSDLPRELSARAAHIAETTAPNKRGAVWQQLRESITEEVAKIRNQYEEMITRARPKVQNALLADEKIMQSTSTVQRGQSINRAITSYFDAQVEVAKNAADAADSIKALAEEAFDDVKNPPELRNGAFWSNFRTEVGAIWENELEVRTGILQEGRDNWLSVFEGVTPSQLNEKEVEFMRKGIDATLGDVDQRLDELRYALERNNDKLGSASDSVRPRLEQRIETIKNRISVSFDQRNRLVKRQTDFATGGRRSTTPAGLRAVEKGISAQRKAIKLAQDNGMGELVPNMQAIMDQAVVERTNLITEMIPSDMKKTYDSLNAAVVSRTAELSRTLDGTGAHKAATKNLNQAKTALGKFETSVKTGQTIRDAGQVGPVSLSSQREAAMAALNANDGKLPNTIEEFEEILIDLNNKGELRVNALVRELTEDVDMAEEVLQSSYSQAARFAAKRTEEINAAQRAVLDQVATEGPAGIFPTRQLLEMAELGYIDTPRSLAGTGKVSVALTEAGEELRAVQPSGDLDITDILASLDDPGREFISTIDNMMGDVDESITRLLDTANNPPMSAKQSDDATKFFDNVAKQMERTPELLDEFKSARKVAGTRATSTFKKNFIDYDNRTTGDFIMQRFFPFWMYASRRYPRLIRLAAKHPVLGKYFTQVMFDWDFGFTPTPWGDEFNVHKATLVGGLRRTGSRDFPELHEGYRGGIENTFDWLGRFGLNPTPPVTTALNLMNGEIGASIPPPLNAILHGAESFGANLPAPLDELMFDSRFAQFNMDTVIVEKFGEDAQDIRRLAGLGDEDAQAKMQVAKMETARVMLRGAQAGIFRYKPAAKRDFQGTTQQLVEDTMGIPIEQQEQFKKLGIPISTMIPISKYQRRAIRDTLGEAEYEAWINSTWALRPHAEQVARARVDEFWFESAKVDDQYSLDLEDLSRRWEQAFVSGPDYRDELSNLKRERAYAFDALQAQDRFALAADGIGVPITSEQRAAWQAMFNSPAPLIHPVDELLERYNGIDVDKYRDPVSGQTEWDLFFEEQERIMSDYPEQIQTIAESEINARIRTKGERALAVSRVQLRKYYGVRDEIMGYLEQSNPQLNEAYKMQRRLANAAKLSNDPVDRRYYEQQAIEMMARNPELTIMERLVRDRRQVLRQDPEMEAVFQMWISTPTVPTLGGGSGSFGRRSRRSSRR